jgi:phospholipid transport system substrate-binding protein
MQKQRGFFCLALLLVLFAFSPARADERQEASAFANRLGQQALAIVTNHSEAESQRRAQLEALLAQNFDIDWVGRFALGRSWREASDAQKAQYMTNYRAFILSHYTSNLAEFTNADFHVTQVVPEQSGGQVVTIRVKRPQSEDIIMDYTLRRNKEGQFKVYDIAVEGVSLITTQRSEFASVVQQNGLDYLIQQLGERSRHEAAAANGNGRH